MSGKQIAHAQAAQFDVAVTGQQVGHIDGVRLVFLAVVQDGLDTRQGRCVVDCTQAEALLHRCAPTLTIEDGVAQGHRAVVVRIGREAVIALAIVLDGAARCRHIGDAQRAAIHIAVALQQLRRREGVGRIF